MYSFKSTPSHADILFREAIAVSSIKCYNIHLNCKQSTWAKLRKYLRKIIKKFSRGRQRFFKNTSELPNPKEPGHYNLVY